MNRNGIFLDYQCNFYVFLYKFTFTQHHYIFFLVRELILGAVYMILGPYGYRRAPCTHLHTYEQFRLANLLTIYKPGGGRGKEGT